MPPKLAIPNRCRLEFLGPVIVQSLSGDLLTLDQAQLTSWACLNRKYANKLPRKKEPK